MPEELCLTKWNDPHDFEKSSTGIEHAEEMGRLLENDSRLAEHLSKEAQELRVLIDDSQDIISINLGSHRSVMMRLNLQLTTGTFSLSLFGLIEVAFDMDLESSPEDNHRVFWLMTGITFIGSDLIWRRLLSFLGRQLKAPLPPMMASFPKKSLLADQRMDVKNRRAWSKQDYPGKSLAAAWQTRIFILLKLLSLSGEKIDNWCLNYE